MTKLRLLPSTRFLPETPFIYDETINNTVNANAKPSLNRWQLRRLEYKLNKLNTLKKNGQQIKVVKYGEPESDLSTVQPVNLKKSSYNSRYTNRMSRQSVRSKFNGWAVYQPNRPSFLQARSEVYAAAQVQRVFMVPTLHNGKTFYTLGMWLEHKCYEMPVLCHANVYYLDVQSDRRAV